MIRYFVNHPTAANLLMVGLLAIGILSLPGIKRETFPDFAAAEVEVKVPYPGATSAQVEESICLRLEDAVDAVNDIQEMRCQAQEGFGALTVKMREGAEISRFLDDIKTEVEAIDNFPERAEQPVIKEVGRTDPVVSIAVSGPMDALSLKAYAEQLKARLIQVPEVSLVNISGFSDRHLRIHVPSAKLQQFGLSMVDVANAVARQSVSLPAGTIETRDQDILLRFEDERRNPSALADLVVIGSANGAAIRLGDIASIDDRFELAEKRIEFDGVRAAVLQVTKTKQDDILRVFDAVKGFVESERAIAAPGVKIELTRDVASVVADRLDMLIRNGWQGLVLVFVVLWLFFRLNFSFWVVAGLPVSFLAALFFMSLLGYSINMITMVALLIALGLLMDDAIVISENVATRLHKGDSSYEAAVNGTSQVARGVRQTALKRRRNHS